MSKWLLSISNVGDSNFSGQPVPVLGHSHSLKVFLDVQREPPMFQCVPIVSDPVTGHH